jgi:hypothetical protein
MAAPSPGVRRFAAITVYVLAAGWGVYSAVGREDSPARWVISLGLAVACTVWCAADAAARGRSLVWPARIGIFLIWPVGVPIYLVWSRGARGVVTAVLAGVGWLALMFVVFMVSGYMTYGSAWFGRGE